MNGPLPGLLALVVWAGHFAAIYAANALACERDLAAVQLLGLGFVPASVLALTVAALLLLALLARPAWRPAAGEAPRFDRWFASGATALAALAVLFQAVPVLVVPTCG